MIECKECGRTDPRAGATWGCRACLARVHDDVRVGGPGDTGCYSRSGKACEGYLGSGCRHCGRIIGSRASKPLRPLADETTERSETS